MATQRELKKKTHEKTMVEAFLRWSGAGQGLVLTEWEREKPDALIQTDGGDRIGVEVTAIAEKNPRHVARPQQWTAEAARIVDAARKAFEAHHSVPLVVAIGLSPDWRPGMQSKITLARQLATMVERVAAGSALRAHSPVVLHNPHPEVPWAYVALTKAALGSLWQPSFDYDVRRASAEDIVATVQRKESDLPVYQRVAPRVWLLIDCAVSGQGVALEVPDPSFTITSDFERVFCCGFGMCEWVEVPAIRQNDSHGTTRAGIAGL